MKIEAGKYYRTRDGRKVGPMAETGARDFPWTGHNVLTGSESYRYDGSWSTQVGRRVEYDLVAEWTDEPASKPSPFVTRRELVPGVYGKVKVYAPIQGEITVKVDTYLTADELDEAAHLFAQLAEYLREKT